MSENKPLRWGLTTGACATAASKAALELLLSGQKKERVTIVLPINETVDFLIHSCDKSKATATASVIKDGGDDPDATHGLEIQATVSLSDDLGIHFKQGIGVGIVTLTGLEIPIGEPAINPVPRKMICQHLSEILDAHKLQKGIEVTISVPNGEAIGTQTFNPRLGIIGGISILGTTGLVKPYSSEAFIASIQKGIEVAKANQCNHIVINSGGRSERYLKKYLSDLPDFAFIQYGNWIGETLQLLKTFNIHKITLGIMLGKAVKLAEGHLNTHSKQVVFNPTFLTQIAIETGYDIEIQSKIMALNLARNITEFIPFSIKEPFYQKLIDCCNTVCKKQIGSNNIQILLLDNEGEILSTSNRS